MRPREVSTPRVRRAAVSSSTSKIRTRSGRVGPHAQRPRRPRSQHRARRHRCRWYANVDERKRSAISTSWRSRAGRMVCSTNWRGWPCRGASRMAISLEVSRRIWRMVADGRAAGLADERGRDCVGGEQFEYVELGPLARAVGPFECDELAAECGEPRGGCVGVMSGGLGGGHGPSVLRGSALLLRFALEVRDLFQGEDARSPAHLRAGRSAEQAGGILVDELDGLDDAELAPCGMLDKTLSRTGSSALSSARVGAMSAATSRRS